MDKPSASTLKQFFPYVVVLKTGTPLSKSPGEAILKTFPVRK